MQRYYAIIRMGLLIAMFAVGYLLLMAWQKDNAALTASQAPQAAAQVTGGADVPSAATANTNSDLPAAAQVATPNTIEQANSNSNLITVKTDIYQISIDPKGGDIVKADLLKHLAVGNTDKPFTLLEQDSARTYIAQSGLIGVNGPDANPAGRPLYTATGNQFELMQGQKQLVVPLSFTDANGVKYTKTYTFNAGAYPINVDMTIQNNAATPWQGQLFGQLKRDNSEDPSKSHQGMMGMSTFLGGAWGKPDATYNKIKLAEFAESPLNTTAQGGYIAMIQHYFVSAWIPDAASTVTFTTKENSGNNIISFIANPVSIPAGQQATLKATLYAGPKIQSLLKPLATGLDQTVDYGKLWPIAQPLFWGLNAFHNLVKNWGWSIILLTIAVKIILWPLASKSYHSMAKMKLIAPEMQRLKDDIGEDKQRFAQEMMKLYQREKVNPLSGCLPILLQMPIFLALYTVFVESAELRHAPWIGWITDLSSMDKWFVLPLIMGVTMYAQQMLNPQPADPTQAKVLKLMPIIFTVFMLWFPAGLVLYWCVNNIVTIIQQSIINRSTAKLSLSTHES